MESIPLLKDIVILLAVSVPMTVVLTRFGLPTIVGFFLTGLIIGPSTLGLVTEVETIETLAQIGVVLLLFTIGLEFSVTRMLGVKREAMLGGGLQLGLTITLVWIFATVMGLDFEVALLLGFAVSLSSSAIVLKLLTDRVEVNSSHGKLSVGILLFQDICVVLMVLVLQGLAGGPDGMGGAVGGTGSSVIIILKEIAIALLAMALIVVTVAYLVPKLFHEVVKLRNREVFILTVVLVCLGTAWLTSLIGLSLAIGAFVAGLAISESEYSNQIVAEVLPFRDTFSSLFFISIGMLLEVDYLASHALTVLAVVAGIVALKALVVVGAGRALGYPLRLSVIVGLNLAQIGEFSFILIMMGEEYGFMTEDLYQLMLSATIVSMALTPFVFQFSPRIASAVGRVFGARIPKDRVDIKAGLKEHVIIVGYGLNGRNLARVLKETAIGHIVMDVNTDRIRSARKEGHRAHFGDSSHPEILKRMGIENAKMLVLAISDPFATRRTVKFARELNPTINIIVRTRYIDELEDLYRIGANQVISEEFETSVEIFANVLREYRVPGNIIKNQIAIVRQEGYAMLRDPSMETDMLESLRNILETSTMDTFFVEEGCAVEGRTLGELDLRARTGGVTVMAVIRKGNATTNPQGDFKIETGDMLVLLGSHFELNAAMQILREECPVAPPPGSDEEGEDAGDEEGEGGKEG